MVAILMLPGCVSVNPSQAAASAVEQYFNKLVEKDENGMINSSCAAWEENARLEYNSFAAVGLNMEGLNCQDTGEASDYVIVSCEGIIIANYGAEDLEIDIAERNYRVVQEGGEWRMCGYDE